MKIANHLEAEMIYPFWFTSKREWFESDKSLSSLEAIMAPLNPINNVRCDTSVWDAGILVNPEKIGLNISLIKRSENGKATNKIKIMLAA